MSESRGSEILKVLDLERKCLGEPTTGGGRIVREHSLEGSECRVVYSQCTAVTIDGDIQAEMSRARSRGYTLEWKVYGHDFPPNLGDRLVAAGFAPGALESVMVCVVDEMTLASLAAPACEIRRVDDMKGLDDAAEIAREIGRANVTEEKCRLALALRARPSELSVYVAYVDGEPVASGRITFREGSDCAELAGGRTKTTHRNRGFFTALVAARLREALARRRTHVFVDALPQSESILKKRGFQTVTQTKPFIYEPNRLPEV